MNTTSFTALITAATLALSTFCAAQTPPEQSLGQPLARQAVLSVLTSKLDSKKSKVGDPVTAKTLNPLQLKDGRVLPRGSKLVGKVTLAQAKASGGAILALTFNEVDSAGLDPMLVHGLLLAVAAAPSLSDGGGTTDDLPLGSGGDAKGRMAAINGTGFGGPGDGLPPITPGSSIKGVVLNPHPSADGSSVLQATDKDIKLESGARLEIGLLAAGDPPVRDSEKPSLTSRPQ